MMIRIDDCIGKHSAKGLRTYVQRTTTNILVGKVEKLLSFLCLPFFFCHRRIRKIDLKLILPSPSSWSDLTTTKRRRDRRKLFHDGDIISALMSPSRKLSLYVVKPMKLLTLISPSSSTEPPWRKRIYHVPSPSLGRRRRR
jgi:hypothetical protein